MADTLQRMPSPKDLREKLTSWDAKTNPIAPLTDKQKDSFIDLTTQSANRQLPIELPLDDFPTVTRHVTPGSDEDALHTELAGISMEKIENAQQFFSWFSEVENKMQKEDEHSQRVYMSELHSYRGECDLILEQLAVALGHLEELREKYVKVSTKTNALHEACEHLLAEQTKLVNTAENINSKLAFFNELERISSKLGSPTLTVTNESFVPMLSRLDECIAYLQKNPQYKESGMFMSRFKQCLSRALNLIKTHVLSILQNATIQVMPKKVYAMTKGGLTTGDTNLDIPTTTDDAFTLFYGKFRTNAPRVKALMEQIEQRVDKSPEYGQLLADCHQCYFSQRLALLGPSVSSAVTELASKHARDHCALMRSGCAFMVHVCEDECQLFYHFFSKHTPGLEMTLESLCTNLYDVFRPLIIHINHLETLAELCSILKMEMLEEHVRNNPEQLAAFETVCEQMLEDVQERLVYRTHIYIRAEILGYKPADGDLAYPAKLEMMESIAASLKKIPRGLSRSSSTSSATSLEVAQINDAAQDGTHSPVQMVPSAGPHESKAEPFVNIPLSDHLPGGIGTNMPLSPADLHGMWYPTVRRTLVCLSKLYRCIDRTTFQGLSQETLSQCIQSLVAASNAITKKKTALDAQLFLIKHLLILREQIAPFHVDFAVKETGLDFSKIKDAAYGLFQHRGKMFAFNSNNALLQFLLEGTPHVTETFIDSKKEVDSQLKHTCEDFISHVSEQFTGPTRDFLNKADVILKMREDNGNPNVALRLQPFASPEKLHDVVSATYRNLKTRKPVVQKSMSLYLANKDTEYILFKPIKAAVQQYFQKLLHLLNEEYSIEDRQIVGCPSLEQINLLLSMTQTPGPGKQLSAAPILAPVPISALAEEAATPAAGLDSPASQAAATIQAAAPTQAVAPIPEAAPTQAAAPIQASASS